METKRQKNNLLKASLESERSTFMAHWRDLSDHILPRRSRFTVSDANKGDRRNQKIIDSTATMAARTLRAGMMSGVTSPARPWFRLTTPDPELAEFGAVKAYLHDVSQRMSTAYLRSNYYKVKPLVYGDLGVFGTAPYSMEEDFQNVIHCHSFPIGSYSIAQDYQGRVNTFFREFRMTVRQLVQMFGVVDGKTGKPDWSKFSNQVRTLWDKGEYETWIDVCHVIQPNAEYDGKKLHSRYKKFSSCYYESGTSANAAQHYLTGDDDNRYLREAGYDYFPILCPRWEVTGEDVYGTDCPGMTALGDIKQLQLGERRAAEAIEKMIRPPMTGPTSLKNAKASILPGDITYVDVREGQQGFRSAHEVSLRLAELEAKQDQVRGRVQRAFYEDLFLMLANSDRREITAREIEERHEEKMLAVGPVLEQINQDDLDPGTEILFDIMNRQGLLPPPPEELQGMNLKIEYISVMAQAQKLVGISGYERLAQFSVPLIQLDSRAAKKIKWDEMIDAYADAVGTAPKVVRTDEEVDEMMAAEAEAQAAQAKVAMIEQGAGAAKDLSQANLEGDNALSRLLQGGGGVPAQ